MLCVSFEIFYLYYNPDDRLATLQGNFINQLLYDSGFSRISSSNDKNSFLDNSIESERFYKLNIFLFLFRVKLYSKFFYIIFTIIFDLKEI